MDVLTKSSAKKSVLVKKFSSVANECVKDYWPPPPTSLVGFEGLGENKTGCVRSGLHHQDLLLWTQGDLFVHCWCFALAFALPLILFHHKDYQQLIPSKQYHSDF
jgi:hypothetical protein